MFSPIRSLQLCYLIGKWSIFFNYYSINMPRSSQMVQYNLIPYNFANPLETGGFIFNPLLSIHATSFQRWFNTNGSPTSLIFRLETGAFIFPARLCTFDETRLIPIESTPASAKEMACVGNNFFASDDHAIIHSMGTSVALPEA